MGRWSLRVTQEFFDQGEEERRLGLPVSALCDRKSLPDLGKSQRGFLEFVCLPLFEELVSFEVMSNVPPVESLSPAMNIDRSLTRVSLNMAGSSARLAEGSESGQARSDSLGNQQRRRSTSKAMYFCQTGLKAAVDQNCVAQIRSNATRWIEDSAVG